MKSDDVDRMIEEMTTNRMREKTRQAPKPINKNITNIPKKAVTLKDIQRVVDALEKRLNK